MNLPARVSMSVAVMLYAVLLAALSVGFPLAAQAQTRVRVGTCARTLTAGVGSQFAVAMKMGWFAQEGLDVEVVPLTGSTDCVKFVAAREFLVTLPSMEPLAIARQQGVKIKNVVGTPQCLACFRSASRTVTQADAPRNRFTPPDATTLEGALG